MRHKLVLSLAGGAAFAMLMALAPPTYAATVQFKADLKGSSEVPPNDSKGTGTVTATLNTSTDELTWKGSYSGLTGPVAAAHFHGPAEPGKNAGVEIAIKPTNSPFSGSKKLNSSQAADLIAGRWYVNLHTKAHPGGELRGQLSKSAE